MKLNSGKSILAALWLAMACHAVSAEDAYFTLPISSLNFTEGALPVAGTTSFGRWQIWPALQPYAVLDEGEVWIGGETPNPWDRSDRVYQNETIAIRAPKDKVVTGRLFVPKADGTGMLPLKFKVEPALAKPASRDAFLNAKESHYRRLLERNVPGGAWFRHEEREAAKARGAKVPERPTNPNQFNRRRPLDVDDTYELFSGGRAISENLQLERLLAPTGSGANTVDITNIAGITVREMDWKALIKDAKPKADPLASFVPFDQHAVFFPSFSAMTELIDEADTDGTPILQLLEPRAEDANSRGRYQKQLCLELNEISRLLGPRVIDSVAFTGSDPYLRTGTDVGILFETKSPGLLKTFIGARQTAIQQTNSTVKSVQGEIEGVPYAGVVSPDRSVSSYVAALDEVVFISNSTYQLGCLLKVAKSKKGALATQDEYTYFRSRYPRGEKDETAFLILTDATIRRWCSPQWRIANSRRTRLAAALAEVQAAHFHELVEGSVKPGPLQSDPTLPDMGELQLTRDGVLASGSGTLGFLAPIAEMPLTKVTQSEADAYNRWRDSYQQNWNQFFDPIAIRFSISARQLGAELAVMPLIAGSDYRRFMSLSTGARIVPGAGDPHPEALMHLAMAINPQSEMIAGAGNLLGSVSPSLKANPLGWLGQSIALYADSDPFWDRLGQAESGSKFMEKNYHQLPLALHCEVKNSLGLAGFLTALRAFVDQTAPKMTGWQNSEYKGQPYVKITPAEEAGEGAMTNLAVFYAATPKSLVVTLSESLLKRALDRQSARETARAEGKPTPAQTKPWLGTNLCLQIDQQFLTAIDRLSRDEYQSAQQLLSWSSLPILNEWKRLYPECDPVKLHEQFWQTKLICPGGGTYVWNAQWQTMESTVYGHPGEPKKGPGKFLPLARVTSANLGLTFENQGLSARAVLERAGGSPGLSR